jgi:hypothetical protein
VSFKKVGDLLGLPVRSFSPSRVTSWGFNPSDDPVIFVSDDLFCPLEKVQKGKELNDFQRNLLDIEILSNLRFDSLEIRDTSVTRVTNNSCLFTERVPVIKLICSTCQS